MDTLHTFHLGGHCCCTKDNTFDTLITSVLSQGWTCCQVFLGSAQDMANRRTFTITELNACIEICADFGFAVYTHFPYKMNLVKPQTNNSLRGLQGELNTLAPLSGRIVIHPNSPTIANGPSNKQTSSKLYVPQYKAAIDTMMVNLKKLKYPYPHALLLEPPAGEGQKIGWSFDQMEYIAAGLKRENLAVGFCIDTCHAFAAGLSDFGSEKAVDDFLLHLDQIGVLSLVKVIHLNDSKEPFGSMHDVHASLCEGYIWKQSSIGLYGLVNRCRELGIDIICETDGFFGVDVCEQLLDDNYLANP
jgi:endonuclease IV